MKFPNANAAAMCIFLKTIYIWRFTPHGITTINAILFAAENSLGVEDVIYFNYTKYTAFRWKYFQQHKDFTE